MLKSLFGELDPPRDPAGRALAADEPPESHFAATSVLESVATEMNERGQMVDRHSQDLVVQGSASQAMREHFAATRADLETASRMITLIDPAGVWASAVIHALSDAGGRPIERLHLREHGTLRTLATIERTTLVRRHEDTLKIVHAQVRAPGRDSAEIPVALMERSQLTTVIVGPLQPHAIDDLLVSLLEASRLPTWRCPHLLFMLPPGAVWIANKLGSIAWPSTLDVHVIDEPLVSASTVWNAMLGLWNRVKARPGSSASPAAAESPSAADAGAPALRVARASLAPARARSALAGLAALDGVLGCAVVDSGTGLVIAREGRNDLQVDMDLACAASAQLMRAHRQTARSMGLAEHIDEVSTSAGPRQQLMCTLSRHPAQFIVVLLDRRRADLALVRQRLAEVEQVLA